MPDHRGSGRNHLVGRATVERACRSSRSPELMKRTTTKALAIALFASLAFSGVVSAKDHGTRRGHATTHGPSVQFGTEATAASLTTKGNASHPGGVFRVLAVLHAAKDLRPPTVDAIVHFASGDVPA